MDGGHPLERCEEVTNVVLDSVFSHLFAARVSLEGMVLKPNMVIPGKKCADQASPARIAEATVRTLKRQVPSAVPGIAFLSGGQSPTDATLHLNLMHAAGPLPWALTFSYGRALQEDALRAWAGKSSGLVSGQKALATRAKLNGLAAAGEYSAAMEASAA
jgi:fructose-bisphosphate aldolase class I